MLTYDLLKEDPGEFLLRLTSFMGTDVNMKQKATTTHRRKPIHSAFSEKQLIILRQWNRFCVYKPTQDAAPFMKKIHRKYHEFLLHIVAFFARFVPRGMLSNKKFLSGADRLELKRIREYYADDWAFCLDYCQKNRNVER